MPIENEDAGNAAKHKSEARRPRGFWGTGRKVVANLWIRTRREHCFLITIETMRTPSSKARQTESFVSWANASGLLFPAQLLIFAETFRRIRGVRRRRLIKARLCISRAAPPIWSARQKTQIRLIKPTRCGCSLLLLRCWWRLILWISNRPGGFCPFWSCFLRSLFRDRNYKMRPPPLLSSIASVVMENNVKLWRSAHGLLTGGPNNAAYKRV